ncbi:MAG: AsmA-like C-terminal region-containing protein [Cyclobacteriaceae bacterium]|nr:MAG: AsmA-like C-terminal region-containing protein [Cyclobacteriaceae bacterium]
MKTFRKVLFYVALVVSVAVISLVVSAFLFKDQIIKQFILKANEQLSTPVKIGKIDVSVFQRFPHMSIVFKDVYVEDSHAGQYPLLTAKQISFHLNPVEVYRGQYTIQGLQISDSETNLKINAKGENNYTITKSTGNGGPIKFELKNVVLKNTRVRYIDLERTDEMIFTSEQLYTTIRSFNDVYAITAKGDVTTEKMDVGNVDLLAGKTFVVNTSLDYDDDNKAIQIKSGDLILGTSLFNVQGTYRWKAKNEINLVAEGENTDIQTLLSLLPEKNASAYQQYQSRGDVYFRASLQGEISKNKSPGFSATFGFNKATFLHPTYSSKIEDANLEGSFATSSLRDASAGVLSLKNMTGKLNGQPFRANLVVRNFSDPDVILDFKGDLDAQAIVNFYPIATLSQVSGTLITDIAFEGRLSWLKSKATAQRTSTRGSIQATDLNFVYGKDEIPVKNLNGTFQFNNNDLALSNVSGSLGSSDFRLNGFFKNIVTFLLFEDQPVGIEADLKSNSLNVDELFAYAFGRESDKTGEATAYEFKISRNINLNFNCDVQRLNYKRFTGQNLKGDLLVKNQVAISRNIQVNAMGGALTLSGIVDANNPKAIDVMSTFKLNGLAVDSIFYVFENFYQDFIEDRHLKGQAYADVTLDMTLNQNLKLFPETLVADISATIKNGELNNFEPLKSLNKYLDDESLSALRFADLKNDIHIENKTVYIPMMEVRSNATVLQISGTHKFDQHIDYRVVTPLNNRRKIDINEAAGAIEEMEGRAKLFLKIVGTTDDYRVLYDTEAVKKKIIADLKKEVQELRDIFKNKKKKKDVELSTEEFDWDNENQ